MTRLANGFLRVALLLFVATVVSACQSSQSAYWGNLAQGVKVTVSVPPSPTDAKIARVSEQLAKQCAVVKGGMLMADLYVSDAKVQSALDAASLTVDRFCDRPPVNVDEALALVAAAAVDLIRALEGAQS